MKAKVTILLDNIRSVHNVGSFFRIADSLGIADMALGGITPTPLDRFGRPRKDLHKVALGAETCVPWKHVDSLKYTHDFHSNGGHVVVLEQHPKSIDYKKFIVPNTPILFVVGNEVDGVNKEICDIADAIIELPQRGNKESLNVAVAGGIVLYRLFDKIIES